MRNDEVCRRSASCTPYKIITQDMGSDKNVDVEKSCDKPCIRENDLGMNETIEKSEQAMPAMKGNVKCQSKPVLFSDMDETLTIDV